MDPSLGPLEVAPELRGVFDIAFSPVLRRIRGLDSSVLAVEFGERVRRTANFGQFTSARRFHGGDGSPVWHQFSAVRRGKRLG